MKKLQLIHLLFLVSLIFSLAACKSSSDVMSSNWIQKRKYTKGFYVSKKAKTESDHAKLEKENKKHEAKTELILPTEEATQPITDPVAQEHSSKKLLITSKGVESKKSVSTADRSELLTSTKSITSNAEEFKQARSKNELAQITELVKAPVNQSPNDDTELLLMVILAILLPPLAVFVMYGLETPFWISLLLTILFILPGVIHALYHVFQNY